MADGNSPATEKKEELIGIVISITSFSRDEAEIFLQDHRWDLNAAVTSFTSHTAVESNVPNPSGEQLLLDYPDRSHSPSPRRFRSRSPPPPNAARYTRRPNHAADNPSENNGGGHQSWEMVQHHPGNADVERQRRSTVRSLRGINSARPRPLMVFTLTVWRNGFTLNDGPLEKLDDPANAEFREYLQNPDNARPREFYRRDINTTVRFEVIRHQGEDFPGYYMEPPHSVPAELPATSVSLEVDPAAPTTWICIRLLDGTRITSEFNTHHTIEDIRRFIDESTPAGSAEYELLSVGFPHSPLPDLTQTIEDAGIAKSVLIQKLDDFLGT